MNTLAKRLTMEEVIERLFESAVDHYVIAHEHLGSLVGWAKKYNIEQWRSDCQKCHGDGIFFDPDWAPCGGEAFWTGSMGRWFACPECEFGQALKRLETQVRNMLDKDPRHKEHMVDVMVRCEAAFEAGYNQRSPSSKKKGSVKQFVNKVRALIRR